MLARLSKGPTAPTTDLVALLMDCHARIRHFAKLAHRIGVDLEATPANRSEACLAVERYFTEALPLHVQDEEESILPRLGPEAACTTWRALYLRLQELEGELMDHIALENNVLFPKALNPERAAS